MKIVEKMREILKDEVSMIGKEIGMKERLIGSNKLKGKGIEISCKGGVKREKMEIMREEEEIYMDEIRKDGIYDEIWKDLEVMIKVKKVGVMGDGRN